ncbi:MAG TPA: DUF1957 domain-containing protein, partial [Firmicutes bacterium]|nr:DUF1957 domain-containing protein [Bacillota bacterium]
MEKGYLALVLHAHLPYVRHPERPRFLEEDWFFEAITETYVPLIKVFDRLIDDGVPFRITISLSPPLMSMLNDPLLIERYGRHLDNLITLAEREVERTRWVPAFHELALMYLSLFREVRYIVFEKYGACLLRAFKKFFDAGRVELITCAATHGYLPMMRLNREALRAQVGVGVQTFRNLMGFNPKGIWLPECGYFPGLDEILKEYGIRYFFTDSHGIMHAVPRPKYGVFAPLYCPSGTAVFARDMESSKQVWSASEGYPGDPVYREFYRDIGYDLEYDYIRPFLHDDGIRVNTGIKYYRITGATSNKEPYVPWTALEKAAVHAGNFMFNREQQVGYLAEFLDRKPIVVSPYDAELFGHWWFEGPDWLNYLIRKTAYDQKNIKLITPGDYLKLYPKNQVAVPSESSWGYKGFHEVWLEGSNDWIYRHLHQAAARMTELANDHPGADGQLRRALNQAARELLLAQSSDWAFIMKTGTMTAYAIRRTKDHLHRFTCIYESIKAGHIDDGWLSDIEYKDNLFPDIDYTIYHSPWRSAN